MIEITTAKLGSRKNIKIDGHVYSVRKPGAGEQLSISQMVREVNKYAEIEKTRTLTAEEEKFILDKTARMMEIMTACFDDLGDGSKSKALVDSLSMDELQAVIEEIFADGTPKAEQTETAS